MSYVAGQFVVLPPMGKLNSILKYTDTLIYIAVRSFNGDANGCFPAYETIAEKAKCSRGFVIKGIERLELSGWLRVVRSGKVKDPNRYIFTESYKFEQIPYSFFDADLTVNEKAMLLCLLPFFRHSILTSIESNKELAKRLGLTYKIVHKNITSLVKKGYIEEVPNKNRKYYRKFTNKLPWKDFTNGIEPSPLFPGLVMTPLIVSD